MSAAKLLDLSHTVEHGMVTYQGLPAPLICDFLSREASRAFYAPGTEFHIGRIDMVANTGTYLDSPFHRFRLGSRTSLNCRSNRWRICPALWCGTRAAPSRPAHSMASTCAARRC
jgi:hypothetical protein